MAVISIAALRDSANALITDSGSAQIFVPGGDPIELARHTAAGSGTAGGPTSGAGAPTLARHVAAGSGSTGTEGSGTPTLIRHSGSGSGTTAALPSITGSGSPSLIRCTAAGSGTTAPPDITGSAGITLLRHEIAGAGTVALGPVVGSGALTLQRHGARGGDAAIGDVKALPFEYTTRSLQYVNEAGYNQRQLIEERDRQLEDYLAQQSATLAALIARIEALEGP